MHFHYVLSLGAVFGVFSGFYYWLERILGVAYPETLAKIHFWITFIAANITFGPMHFLGQYSSAQINSTICWEILKAQLYCVYPNLIKFI